MNTTRRTFILRTCLPLLIALNATAQNTSRPVRSVLFVGNSYSFEVPKVFAELCKQTGRDVKVEQITKGGWTFAQHEAGGSTKRFAEGWDVIVFQGQSQEPSFSEEQVRLASLPAASNLIAAARAAGARPLLYETWGRRDGDQHNAAKDDYAKMQKRLIAGYALIAKETKAEIAPVGHAWQSIRAKHPELDLYSKDGSHPNALGIHLAASVFYATIFRADAANLPDLKVPHATAQLLHEAAHDVRKFQ